MIQEVAEFKKEGGSTIVENTTYGIQRNVDDLKKISLATGVNIISGTGYYLDQTQTSEVKSASVEELSDVSKTYGQNDTTIINVTINVVGLSYVVFIFPVFVFHTPMLDGRNNKNILH
jgi:phosphotriesterase-related protein